MQHFDVVILGAGPAGAATALALRKSHPHLSSVMVEAGDFQAMRMGEILTAESMTVLKQLDVFDSFMDLQHPCVSAHSRCWGSPSTAQQTFDGGAPSGGWHIDRARFDGMLAGVAAASGVGFIRASVSSAQLDSAGLFWNITALSSIATHRLKATFVVDATGRSARFASQIGVAQAAHDTLVGLVRVFEADHISPANGCPLIEACEYGWWYSARLPGKRLVIAAMTDADISKRLQLTEFAQWKEHLECAPQTRQRLADAAEKGDLHVRAANTRSLYNCSGKNWLAVGDAAASVDPLCASGIARALRFGIHASDAIGAQFKGDLPNLDIYEALVQAEFQRYLKQRVEDYRKELRWENSPFWIRRHTAPIISMTTIPDRRSTLSVAQGPANSSCAVPPASIR